MMATLQNDDQHSTIGHATEATSGGEDEIIIREELQRRAEFDRQHTKALRRLFLRSAEASEEERALRRRQIVAEAAPEVSRRLAFDEKYPRIYKSAEERREAYLVFHAPTVLERLQQLDVKMWDEDGP
jgi:hypothetical protein